MFSNAQNVQIYDGQITMNQKNYHSSHDRYMELLEAAVSTNAFHNSEQRFDPPKCHPQTRTALLDRLSKWANGVVDPDKRLAWMYGAAGTGKSAIEQSLAELFASGECDVAVSTFFFSRSDGSRNHSRAFVATIVYQMVMTTPDLLPHVQSALRHDPLLLRKNLDEQVNKLIIEPFRSVLSMVHNGTLARQLIIIDGLDECMDGTRSQLINIISRLVDTFQDDSLIVVSFASRPETDIKNTFNFTSISQTLLRIALDDDYRAHDDIRLFFSDKFDSIRRGRPEIRGIESWPTEEQLKSLVWKASGQFIYASTVVEFVSSVYHNPRKRLDIVLGLSPPSQGTTPFAQLDALYTQILLSVPEDCVEEGLKVITLILVMSSVTPIVDTFVAAHIMGLDESDIRSHVNNYSGIMRLSSLSASDSSVYVNILHASLGDFLFDRPRSKSLAKDYDAEHAWVCGRLLQFLVSSSLDPSTPDEVFDYALYNIVDYILRTPRTSVSDYFRCLLSERFVRNLVESSTCKYTALACVLLPIFSFISSSEDNTLELYDIHSQITDRVLTLFLKELGPWNRSLLALLCRKELPFHIFRNEATMCSWLFAGMGNLFDVSFRGYAKSVFTWHNCLFLSRADIVKAFFDDPSRCKETHALKLSEYEALAVHCLLRISRGASLPYDDANIIPTKKVIPNYPVIFAEHPFPYKSLSKSVIVPWPQYYDFASVDNDQNMFEQKQWAQMSTQSVVSAMRAAWILLPHLLENSPPSVEIIKLCRPPNLKRFPWVVQPKLAREAAKAMADYRRRFTFGRPSRQRPRDPQAANSLPLPSISRSLKISDVSNDSPNNPTSTASSLEACTICTSMSTQVTVTVI